MPGEGAEKGKRGARLGIAQGAKGCVAGGWAGTLRTGLRAIRTQRMRGIRGDGVGAGLGTGEGAKKCVAGGWAGTWRMALCAIRI